MEANKKSNKNYAKAPNKNRSVENEFIDNEEEFEGSMGGGGGGGVTLADNGNRIKRTTSSINFENANVNIEQFRREMFPDKKLEFEQKKE